MPAISVGSTKNRGRSPPAVTCPSFHVLIAANDWSNLASFLYFPMWVYASPGIRNRYWRLGLKRLLSGEKIDWPRFRQKRPGIMAHRPPSPGPAIQTLIPTKDMSDLVSIIAPAVRVKESRNLKLLLAIRDRMWVAWQVDGLPAIMAESLRRHGPPSARKFGKLRKLKSLKSIKNLKIPKKIRTPRKLRGWEDSLRYALTLANPEM